MKILISIFINALILFIMAYLLGPNSDIWITNWIIVNWWITTYLTWWIILWLINVIIKPILKILSIPLFFVFFWLVVFIINAFVLKILNYIMDSILAMPSTISYEIVGIPNFIIAVTIFTILNMLFNIFWFKTKW